MNKMWKPSLRKLGLVWGLKNMTDVRKPNRGEKSRQKMAQVIGWFKTVPIQEHDERRGARDLATRSCETAEPGWLLSLRS